nr:CoA-binding protein [Spirochaetota bacterium]
MKKRQADTIQRLFEPESFAVIGASQDPAKIGHKIFRNILSGGYRGRLYPVSPAGGEILGHKAHKAIEDIDDAIDQATIVIPAKFVIDAVKSCAKKGVKHVQIITSGFSEVGNNAEEHEIVDIASAAGMRVLGPNIFGLYSASSSLNSTFSATSIMPGNVAILTQSGALGIAMIGQTAVGNIRL